MRNIHQYEFPILVIGDIIALVLSLFITLAVRYTTWLPFGEFGQHIAPFSILFVAFLLVAFIAGLYEKQTLFIKNRLPQLLLNVQIVHAIFGIAFFYFIPFFSITPKIVLFIYLLISLGLIALWRIYIFPRMSSRKLQRAILIGSGDEVSQLENEINHNQRYGVHVVRTILPTESLASHATEITSIVQSQSISMIILDLHNPHVESVLPSLYELMFKGIVFIDTSTLYEDVFDREPVSLLDQTWFVENISTSPKVGYDIFKRGMDIVLSLIAGVISLIFYPFVIAAIKLDDGGVIYSYQQRVGQNNKIVSIAKFRTMTVANDEGRWDDVANLNNPAGEHKVKNEITRVGKFLRKSRLDELPQLWNVLRGDISLIGPRPEFPEPVERYSKTIPYYNVRHIVKPGLSGWAQIYHEQHPHHGIDIEETRNKLSYDLYYIKHRSLMIDIKIALRTLKVLMTFAGR